MCTLTCTMCKENVITFYFMLIDNLTKGKAISASPEALIVAAWKHCFQTGC